MNLVELRVVHAGPLVSVQDGGRRGLMRFGVPASGPMDRKALAIANVAVGNPSDAAGIEVSASGLTLDCTAGEVTLALAGGGFDVAVDDTRQPDWAVFGLHAGQRLSVRAGAWGSWACLAVAGRLEAPDWLGSRATHALSGLGGGALTTGQVIRIADAERRTGREGALDVPDFATARHLLHVVPGPQDRHFAPDALSTLTGQPFAVTPAFDRMGMRLAGPGLVPTGALGIPSEPVVRGSIQVAGDGVATILMADHQTTGGYPKLATVLADDLDGLAQCRPGDSLRFRAITAAEAVALARSRATTFHDWLESLKPPRPTLEERLMQANLIGGIVGPDDTA
ncbi:MAG: biotin-dependent carboxyltransferase family protein [Paracoccaceae bacterium]